MVAGSLFTPEYSTELQKCVRSIYDDDILYYYPKLKLEKLIDLLEHTAYLFESYREFLGGGKNDDALSAYIVGCYYLFLIIPRSTQFQAKNKSYSIYNDLKMIYQSEVNMTNVLAMVKNQVDTLLDQFSEQWEHSNRLSKRERAYSAPDEHSLAQSLRQISIKNQANSSQVALHKEEESVAMWTAPHLEPNDQLKVAVDPLYSLQRHASLTAPTTEKNLISSGIQDSNFPVDRFITHRKDSYHSVYMDNDDLEGTYDIPNGPTTYFQSLERFRKQDIITCNDLFALLSNPTERENILLIDLRLNKSFQHNHIIAPYLLNVDPNLLWNSKENCPIQNDVVLEQLIDDPLFYNRHNFNYIVYYTDTRSYTNVHYDYNFIFFYLLVAFSRKPLKSMPLSLLGGYEKWKSIVRSNGRKYDININDFLYTSTKVTSKEQLPSPPNKKVPVVLEQPFHKPPQLPSRFKIRPPSPSSQRSMGNEFTPPLPPKLALPPQIPSITPVPSASEIKKNIANRHMLDDKHTRQLYLESKRRREHQQPPNRKTPETFQIPTIEHSNNIYVSLSITGLRNMGNTCYINSMVQCLFATTAFKELFLTSSFEKYFSQKASPVSLSKSFSVLFQKLYLNGGCSVVPNGFLKTCNMLRPDLRIPDDQQDTQEFLMLVLDRLHDELSNQEAVVNDYPNLLLYNSESLGVNDKEYSKWFENSNLANGLSPIDHIFQGQIENSLNCQRCGFSSCNYSSFYVLSLAMPKPTTSAFGRSKRVKLEDCINMFTNDEVLSGDNAWDCPRCGSGAVEDDRLQAKKQKSNRKSMLFLLPKKNKHDRSLSPFSKSSSSKPRSEKLRHKKLVTIKTSDFITLPPVLVIHLSRFYYDLTKKNDVILIYPLLLNIVLKNNKTEQYRLYGVVNHDGTLASGHYTSLINKDVHHSLNKQQKWYYFDDEVVKEEKNHGNVDEGILKVSSSHAYVLFYEKMH